MVYFVIALPQEAKPLIGHYRLKAVPGANSIKVYEGEDKRLVVSGVGKIRSANATAFLHAFSGSVRNCVWINIGIGGHCGRRIGEGIMAHKITDEISGKNWYPPIAIESSCETESILTVERSETRYRGSWVYEMEASGFYDTALQFSSGELVHCYKVISDNHTSPSKQVSGVLVERLIGANLKTIEEIVKKLTKLAFKLPKVGIVPNEFHKFLERWHFTVTEQHRLRRLLARFRTLEPKAEIFQGELNSLPQSKDVLHFLEHKICSLPVTL